MLGLQNPHAISSCQSFLDTSVLHEVIPCKSKNVNPFISNLSSATLVSSPAKGVSSCSFSWTWPSQLKTYKLSQQSASYRLLVSAYSNILSLLTFNISLCSSCFMVSSVPVTRYYFTWKWVSLLPKYSHQSVQAIQEFSWARRRWQLKSILSYFFLSL